MNKDWLLILVAGYVVYKIGWVDGLTPVNLFLVLCLIIAAAAAFLRHSAYGARLKARRDAEVEAAQQKARAEEKAALLAEEEQDRKDREEIDREEKKD